MGLNSKTAVYAFCILHGSQNVYHISYDSQRYLRGSKYRDIRPTEVENIVRD